MILQRQLKTTKNNMIDIVTDNSDIIQHFADQQNFADIVLNQINQEGIYDRLLRNKDNLTIIDIGANIGLFSLHAQDRARAIYALEPTPGHFKKLQHLTKDFLNIQPINVALNNEDQEVSFYICDYNSTMNSTVNQYGTEIKVQGRTLPTLIKQLGLRHVDIIKCDIEGSEMKALNDSTLQPIADIVDCWFIEAHVTDYSKPWPSNLEQNREILAQLFQRHGYKVEKIIHDTLLVTK